jgi:sialidase-1
MTSRTAAFLTAILIVAGAVIPLETVKATSNARPTQGDLGAFLSSPHFTLQQLYGKKNKKERGGRNIVTAQDGTVLAFDGPRVRRSTDGGKIWGEPIEIGDKANGCNALVDEVTGAVLLVHPDGHRLVSHDDGRTWKHEAITVRSNLIGHGSSQKKNLGAGAMQPGITLTFGKHKGRLLMPVRWTPSNSLQWRPYIYNTAIYSDDRGKTWQTTMPFPVFGTGEAALAEISDGRILYSSREHMSRGNRFFAWSYDGGAQWLNFWRSKILPDGARGTSYGCMGGLIRLPVKSRDILLYSNLDTDKGIMPGIEQAGASRGQEREKITVWVSFDGGETWPAKRLIFDGPSAYSNLGVGRPDTPSEGLIYLLFEGGKESMYSGIQVAVLNLAWLLDGEQTGHGELPEWVEHSK